MSAKVENSETVRRGRIGGGRKRRRFVAPRPDATLSHLVKTGCGQGSPPDMSLILGQYSFGEGQGEVCLWIGGACT
jgi:hypothetical protein